MSAPPSNLLGGDPGPGDRDTELPWTNAATDWGFVGGGTSADPATGVGGVHIDELEGATFYAAIELDWGLASLTVNLGGTPFQYGELTETGS